MFVVKSGLSIMILALMAYGLLPFIAALYAYQKHVDYENIDAIEKAISFHPHGIYLYMAAEYYSRKGQIFQALRYMEEAASQYDGEGRIWHVLNGYGALKMRVGSIHEAKIAYEQSLFFMPYASQNPQAVWALKKIDQMIDHMKGKANASQLNKPSAGSGNCPPSP